MLKIVTVALLLCICFQGTPCCGQLVFYQDVFHGGVTSGGFSTGLGAGSGEVSLYIEPGSTIRKAFLFAFSTFDASEDLYVNNIGFEFNSANRVATFSHTNIVFTPVHLHLIDITEWLQANFTETFVLEVPLQSGLPYEGVFAPFVCIAYENPEMSITNVVIIGNNQNLVGNEDYIINSLNSIDTQFPVGFSLYTDRTGDGFIENNEIYFNSNLLGIVGGSDNVNSLWNGAGVKGHFYYQENQLFGLDDDIANNTMSETDGLADVSEYLDNNAITCSFQLRHLNYPFQSPASTNLNLAYTLAYTTPCLPFETTLTEEVETCRGDTAHLLATGGQDYEWLPEEDLSCYNCPNPVFVGDSSKVYTVRIWNTDSCSKVLPVKVNVLDVPQTVDLATTPATCSESDGVLSINSVSGGTGQYQYNIGGNWTTNPSANMFSILEAGDYTLTVKDENNCTLEQDFTIAEENPANAAFSADPQSGTEPLDVQFINQSNGTNHYQWSLGESTFNDFELNFTFDSAGNYPVQLISWHNESHCADTAMATIIVNPAPPDYSHSIFMPTLYTPQIGDFFIQTTNVQRLEFELYNAIGQHIFSTEAEVADGQNNLWNGSNHARGYYFFRLRFWDMQGLEFSEKGKVLLVR